MTITTTTRDKGTKPMPSHRTAPPKALRANLARRARYHDRSMEDQAIVEGLRLLTMNPPRAGRAAALRLIEAVAS